MKSYDLNNLGVDHVYVVTVQTFKARIEHIKKEMAKHDIAFTFFYEHYSPNLDEDIANKFNVDMKRGYKANVLQHIAMWKDVVDKGYKRVLVFEDDVILHKNFREKFSEVINAANELQEDYVIFLGGADTKVPKDFFLSKETLYPLPIATSEGLVMDVAGIKRRLNWVSNNKIHCPIDHLIAHIDTVESAKSYWSRTPLTEQASIMGSIKSELDNHRLKHSPLFIRLRYYWNKFQRRQARSYIVRINHFLARLIN